VRHWRAEDIEHCEVGKDELKVVVIKVLRKESAGGEQGSMMN